MRNNGTLRTMAIQKAHNEQDKAVRRERIRKLLSEEGLSLSAIKERLGIPQGTSLKVLRKMAGLD